MKVPVSSEHSIISMIQSMTALYVQVIFFMLGFFFMFAVTYKAKVK